MRTPLLVLVLWVMGSASAQTFQGVTGQPNRNERGLVLHRSASGAIFLGGSAGDSALVQRIDADGNVLWSKAFRPGGQYPKMVYHMADAPDGTIIGCGNGLSPIAQVYEGFHFKFDENGNFQWVRSWTDGLMYNREVAAFSATEMIMFSAYYANGGSYSDYVQSRIDLATGDLNWMSPRYDLYPSVPYIDDVVGVVRTGDSYYATGRIFTNGSPVSTCRVNLTKLDAQGQHLWTRYLIYPNNISRRMYGCDIIATADSLTIIYSGDVTGASGNLSVGMIRTDTLGNVAWARDYNINGSANEHVSQVIPASFGYVMMGRTVAAPNQRSFLMGVSFGGDLLWTRMYGAASDVHIAPHTYLKGLIDMGDGYLFTGVSRTGADDNVLLVRTDEDGLVGCATVTDPVVVTTVLPTDHYDTAPVTYPISLALDATGPVDGPTHLDGTCALQFSLGADTTACSSITLHAALPGATFTWQDGSMADTLVVSVPGQYWATATVGCCTTTDTIEVFPGAMASVDLGPDTAVCDYSEITLHVGSQWNSVLWSMGSTDDTLVVTVPGTYWVEVEAGGCIASDTVLVYQAEGALLDLGPDTLICPGGVLQLQLDTLWDAVLWSDGTALDSLIVSAPGIYWVDALVGICPQADTIVIQQAILPPLELGADTSLCTGAIFSTGVDATWEAVLWNDGSTADSLFVTSAGVIAVDVSWNGCAASDSLLLSFTVPPVVDLGPDTSSCEGAAVVLATGLAGLPHLWQDGSNGTTYSATATGSVWVEAGPAGCASSDTVNVVFNPLPVVDLGPDTTYCIGSPITLGPVATTGWVLWSDGSDAATLVVAQEGEYWATANEMGCTASDSVQVVELALPQVLLGPDTANCTGQAIVLSPLIASGGTLQWSTGAITPWLAAVVSGTYGLAVANSCATVSDSVEVSINGPVEVDLGGDTTICGAIQLALFSGQPAGNPIWSTGEQAVQIIVNTAGSYWVSVDVNDCMASDTIVVDQAASPLVNLIADTVLCEPAPIELLPTELIADVLIWPDGTTGPSFIATQPGTYAVTAANPCGEATDAVMISLAPEPSIERYHQVCFGGSAVIALPADASGISWSSGDSASIVSFTEGEYTYTYTDAFGCARSGEIEVFVDPSADGLVFVPNVFTPNTDEINDGFKVVGAEQEEFELSIFDRWGEIIFKSADPEAAWDGSCNGVMVPDGTYVYVLRYRDRCNGTHRAERIGHVTVIR